MIETKVPNFLEKSQVLFQYIQMLVQKTAVVAVPEKEKFKGVYSIMMKKRVFVQF